MADPIPEPAVGRSALLSNFARRVVNRLSTGVGGRQGGRYALVRTEDEQQLPQAGVEGEHGQQLASRQGLPLSRVLQTADGKALLGGGASSGLTSGSPKKGSHIEDGVVAAVGGGTNNCSMGEGATRLCRICLEEDSLASLERPCACAGTQEYAHRECLQKWINEKGNLRCEVCEHDYTGPYDVPPEKVELGTPTLLGTPHSVFLTLNGTVIGPQTTLDMLEHDMEHPGLRWSFSVLVFVVFMIVLHHTMAMAPTDARPEDSPAAGPPSSPSSHTPSGPPMHGLLLFLFWFLTKTLLIFLPLYTLMRVAAARRSATEMSEAMFSMEPSRVVMTRGVISLGSDRSGGRADSAREGVNAV